MTTACVHQVIRGGTWEPPPDWGDCRTCTAHPDNARCPGYKPFPIPSPERTIPACRRPP